MIDELKNQAIELLIQLIKTPSFSKEEDDTATIIEQFFNSNNIHYTRKLNNIFAFNKQYSEDKKTILLNSHHDTVKPGNWIYDPFGATIEGDKLIGLGSNDAGASVVSLLATFCYFYDKKLPYNLIIAITAEEEISGVNGIKSILPELGKIELGIVGEPTQMQMAIAEKGLIVLDCETHGKTGHAARNEGVNAIYEAFDDLNWFRTYQFDKISDLLGPTKMTVTQIEAGKQHNVIPDVCRYVVDIRTNELYSNVEVIDFITQQIKGKITPRSYHLNSSRISPDHAIVLKGKQLGLSTYGSPTLSDQSVMDFETIKIGPGDSARSHTPDEFIYLEEIRNGIDLYIKILSNLEF